MPFSVRLTMPADAQHALGDEQEAQRRLNAGGQRSADVPRVDDTAADGLVLTWTALEVDDAWQAVLRAGAVARLLVDDFDAHTAVTVSVTGA